MRPRSFKLPLLLLLLASGPPAFPQQPGTQPPPATSGAMPSQPAETDRLTRLIGAEVTGADAGPVGVVNDVLFDRNGAMQGLIIAVAGARGLGEKNIALRPDAIHLSQKKWRSGRITPGAISQPQSLAVSTNLTQRDISAAPDFAPQSRSTTAGTPESVHEPKSSTASGGPG